MVFARKYTETWETIFIYRPLNSYQQKVYNDDQMS